MNVDLHLALNRRQHDLIHQRANCVGCLYPLALFFILKRLVELLDAPAILQRHARVEQGRRLLRFGEEVLQFRLTGFKLLHVFHDRFNRPAGFNCSQQLRQFPINLRDLGFG
ncbi:MULTISPECIES: hypothetical protein [unclassified Shinella]|uniref:hypothetical protein n=1 Tax=unclassified Shinella TaxID=2643062 RepID=UPI00234F37D4|nr:MULTISPECIES: hypothetical protein [unclassified Shinella]